MTVVGARIDILLQFFAHLVSESHIRKQACMRSPPRMLKGMLQPMFCILQIHIVAENEKLCKIYFKKIIFQNILAFIDLFYRYLYIRYFTYSDCM